jgi:hypothetical protein
MDRTSMRTTIKIMRRKPVKWRGETGYQHRAYCLRCNRFVHSSNGGQLHDSWVTKASAFKHALKHLEWHQEEDRTPLPERWYWKQDWPTISEVSDGDEKELSA